MKNEQKISGRNGAGWAGAGIGRCPPDPSLTLLDPTHIPHPVGACLQANNHGRADKRKCIHQAAASGGEHIGTRRERGFTLVELMIAMILGLILIAGVAGVFLANRQTYHTTQALSEVQSNARIAFGLLARDIRQAGLLGCNSDSGRLANVLNKGRPNKGDDAAWWADWQQHAVRGYDDDDDDPALTPGSGDGDQVNGTDSVMLLGATGTAYSVQSSDTSANTIKLAQSTVLQKGDVVVVCDPDHAVLAQLTDYDTGSNTLTIGTGTGTPGNCSAGLGYPTDCGSANTYQFPRNSMVSRYEAYDWYIGRNPAGGTSLYRLTNGGSAQEMVRNVTGMKIEYHQSPNKDFDTAHDVTDWSAVDALRITLTLQSSKKAGTDEKPITRDFTTTTAIRNRLG